MNKLSATFAVGLAAFSTALIPSKEVSAALTEPSSYDYAYKFDAVSQTFLAFGDGSPQYSSIPFTRTADGAYYNYSYTGTGGSGQGEWPFEITMDFNRSTTNWDTALGGYEPYATNYVSSNSSVGTIEKKIYLKFDNQTSHDYQVYLDLSSQGNNYLNWQVKINSLYYINNHPSNLNIFIINPYLDLIKFHLPTYSYIEIYSYSSSSAYFFDAWYLEDLGVSDSYTNGYDYGNSIGYEDGYADGLGNNPNVLLNGFETVIGIFVNFVLMVATFDIFGVSIMNILLVFMTVIGLVWILKVLRG